MWMLILLMIWQKTKLWPHLLQNTTSQMYSTMSMSASKRWNLVGENIAHPSKHKIFVQHLYNIGPKSKTLGRHYRNVIQIFCVCWDIFFFIYHHPLTMLTASYFWHNNVLTWMDFAYFSVIILNQFSINLENTNVQSCSDEILVSTISEVRPCNVILRRR